MQPLSWKACIYNSTVGGQLFSFIKNHFKKKRIERTERISKSMDLNDFIHFGLNSNNLQDDVAQVLYRNLCVLIKDHEATIHNIITGNFRVLSYGVRSRFAHEEEEEEILQPYKNRDNKND